MDAGPLDAAQHGALLLREALLRDAVLYIEGNDAAIENAASPLRSLWKRLAKFSGTAILARQRPWLSPPVPVGPRPVGTGRPVSGPGTVLGRRTQEAAVPDLIAGATICETAAPPSHWSRGTLDAGG